MKSSFIKSLMNSLNSRKRKRERGLSGGFFMKKESNGIGENKNSKKISKNNKIISSILAVIMCCQSFVGANPNSDNRKFVSDKGIDNSPTADGSEEDDEVKDIKIKENNNSSSLIRNSLDALLVAAMGGFWFYGTKNNEEIAKLNEKLSEEVLELGFLNYNDAKIFTFALGKKIVIRKNEGGESKTFFCSLNRNFDTVSSILGCARECFFDDASYEVFGEEIRKAENKIKEELKGMEPYSRFVYNVATDQEDISELTTQEKLAEKLLELLSKCKPEFRLTGFFLTLKEKESGKDIGDIFVSEELARSVILANT
ncbi:MAG: hypothetical protein CfP315_0823 [Candidatus Improbicoccus pseudotrichonymphae]|uniref:Uncharacterized protein n=1 Tax=Candidatus Improbicoccus pseudotrichonymphae TaxID=3033792 RepID=A0AA48L147_9FIRM|nr:MAG: hypothetical protein CfP315_0823 [Candidatus Improbicoccus pseudotrichonymphae]